MQILAGNVYSSGGLFKYGTTDIVEFSVVTQESVKRAGGTIGWGAAGLAVLGPLGMVAGLLGGGKATDITFSVSFADGRQMLARADSREFQQLQAAAFESIRRRAAMPKAPTITEADAPARMVSPPSQPPEGISDLVDQAVWLLEASGHSIQRQPKQPGQRISLVLSKDGEDRRRALAIVPDALTAYNIRQMADALRPYEGRATLFAIGRSVGAEAAKEAKEAGIIAAAIDGLTKVIAISSPAAFDF